MMSLFDKEQIMKTYWKDMENTLAQELEHKLAQELEHKLTREIEHKLTQELEHKLTQELEHKFEYKKDVETAKRMIQKGKMTLEEIADYIPSLSFDELKKIAAEVMQTA